MRNDLGSMTNPPNYQTLLDIDGCNTDELISLVVEFSNLTPSKEKSAE